MADELTTDVPVSEHALSDQWKIPIKKLRAMRPDDVVTDAKAGICWPFEAAKAFAEKNGLPFELPKKNAPGNDVEVLTVASISRGTDGRHFPNPNVIHAKRSNGDVVIVRVVHSGKYRPTLRIGGKPMTLRARRAPFGNWWVLEGREPRYPGQW